MGYKSKLEVEKEEEIEDIVASAQFNIANTEFEIPGFDEIEMLFDTDLKNLDDREEK